MRRPFLWILILLALFVYAVYKSGAIEKYEYRKPSQVPGVPDRTSVEYRWNKGKFARYIKSLLPR